MSKLNLPDIQGIIVRGYRMPMVRYFLLKVGRPPQPARCSGASHLETNAMCFKSRPPTNGMWRRRDPTTIHGRRRSESQTTA